MVTDEERDYMYTEYAKDPRMRLNLGIRRRLAPLMDNGRHQIELMHSLLFTLPGSPVLYYGDEIGMGDNVHLGDRNGVRTPMQWSGDRNAGFSRADPSALYQPVILDPLYNYPGRQRRGPAPVAVLAAPLAEADDPGPPRAQGLRPREPRVPPVPQPSRRRLCPAAPGRHRPGGQQPLALPPGRRARPGRLLRDDPDRDGRPAPRSRRSPTGPTRSRWGLMASTGCTSRSRRREVDDTVRARPSLWPDEAGAEPRPSRSSRTRPPQSESAASTFSRAERILPAQR